MLSRVFTRREQFVLALVAGAIFVGSSVMVWRSLGSPDPSQDGAEVAAIIPIGEPTTPQVPIVADPPGPSAETSSRDDSGAARPDTSEPQDAPAPEIVVSVVGAVRKPGVYRFSGDPRVQDLIDAAGGATDRADVSNLNLAARLIDATTLTVPAQRSAPVGGNQPVLTNTPAAAVPNPPQYTLTGWQTAGDSVPGVAAATPGASIPASSAGASSGHSGLIDLNRATQEELEALPGIGPKLAASIVAYRAEQPFVSVEDLNNVSGIGEKRLDAIRHLVTVSGVGGR